MTIKVATYNLHFDRTQAQAHADLTKLVGAGPEMIGLQEWGKAERYQVLQEVTAIAGWDFYRPNNPGTSQRQTPVLWNAAIWDRIDSFATKLNEETVAEDGAGGATIEAKYAVWVTLQRKADGKKISLVNWHAPASITDPANVIRRQVMKTCTERVAALMEELALVSEVYMTGDMNVDYRNDAVRLEVGFPVERFKRFGSRANWYYDKPETNGTHGDRLIDYVFSTRPAVDSSIRVTGYSSDHKPVVVTY